MTDTQLAQMLPNGASPISGVFSAAQPGAAQFKDLAEAGVKTVIDLRSPTEPRDFDEPSTARAAGLTYHNLPITPGALIDRNFDEFRRLLSDDQVRPVLVHCGSGSRVGALLVPYLVLDENLSRDDAIKIARSVGLRGDDMARSSLAYVDAQEAESAHKKATATSG
ncbi:MAG: protein tyrosine phosphatase family protein [Gemmatimonadaceae bacterium]